MKEEERHRREIYFNMLRKTVFNSPKGYELELMNYIQTVLSNIGEYEITKLSEYAIADMQLKMTDDKGEIKYNDIILANDGDKLAILQYIKGIEENDNGNDILQIGIILDADKGIIRRIDVKRNRKTRIEDELKEYAKILEKAENIERVMEGKNKGGISKLPFLIKNFILAGNVQQGLSRTAIEELLSSFNIAAGKEAYEEYAARIGQEERRKNIQMTTRSPFDIQNDMKKMTSEEREKMENEAKERRSQIVITTKQDDDAR